MNFLLHEFGKGCMLLTLKDCTERLRTVGTIDNTFIAHEMIRAIRLVNYGQTSIINVISLISRISCFVVNSTAGPKSIYLVIIDGGADWVATEQAVTELFPWIHFMHCAAHECSLIVQDICKIDEVNDLITFLTNAQHWFGTNKLGPLLKEFCLQHYGTSRSFYFPAVTRFAGKLLQIKRFLSMKASLQQLVQSAQYLRFRFDPDPFAMRISGRAVWELMERVTSTVGPILLLLRLADSNAATLSKLKGTIDYIKTKLSDQGNDSLEDKICVAFHNRCPELECDISSASYVLDPQFIMKSRRPTAEIMAAFWRVARKVLRIQCEAKWQVKRQLIVGELAKFRMKQDGFAKEDYTTPDTHTFWGVAGCHAPNLHELAFRLTTLPCSSGEAERNWKEVKHNYTKDRNRLDREKLTKIVFVRRFIRLKRKICFDEATPVFSEWVNEMLSKASAKSSDASSSDSEDVLKPFVDHIEPGEQGKTNGKEPGEPVVSLTDLKKNHAAKSWLFEKYFDIHFVDKNPEGVAGAEPLEDESEWEHRVIKDVVWWRNNGFSVESFIRGSVLNQSIEKYLINSVLHEMIRESPHNTRSMISARARIENVLTSSSSSSSESSSTSSDSDSDS